ncbi:DUF1800 domain-containing protein [Mangrovihabitans endophyticus]|uniref:DUF1800 domain-containing protein n=1 Tax=Mangrovihabitans endophyticus TaxID=1751298 RepID=A0A8J3C7M7_9ACTN|nr:DUF1800 domain-containing protein [Mangrovihabitans endophyticus]GGL16555.1 hypothetical protein GCM10012284_58950 [Mangrovihabitans endophyticus]
MTDRPTAAHLLRRLTFGPTASDVDAAVADGADATVAKLLAPATAPQFPDLGADPFGALAHDAGREARQQARQQVRAQVTAATWWWLTAMAGATTPAGRAAEKLTFFWHGHWATSVQKVRSATLMLTQQQTFRRYGLGDTGAMVRAMLRDPALILWLDGQRNTRKAPNENLARELMELFTLGVGHYTEADVKAGARVLTGWQVDRAAGRATLAAKRHDDTPVTVLGQAGVHDVDTYAGVLVRHPAHLPFLAGRLWLRYASGDPAPAEAIRRIAASGRDTATMLRAMVTDPAFPATRGHLVKQPVEWLVGAVRQLGIDLTKLPDKQRPRMTGMLRSLGQVPLRPPSVGGWPSGDAWLTTSSVQARLRAGQALAALTDGPLDDTPVRERVDALARLLVVDGWTARTRAALDQVAAQPRKLLALGLATPEYTVH